MPFAKVVLGLPVEGPFDYLIPEKLALIAVPGSRVKVSFGRLKKCAYITEVTSTSRVRKVKPLSEVLDEYPLLTPELLDFTGRVARSYCSSWGEVIETALPEPLRIGRKIKWDMPDAKVVKTVSAAGSLPGGVTLFHSFQRRRRWDFYLKAVSDTLDAGGSAVVIMPDIPSLVSAGQRLENAFGRENLAILGRNRPDEAIEWLKVRTGRAGVAVGTRSAVFAPLRQSPSLIIIEEENDPVYKQDQVPHYHAVGAAVIRARYSGARLILGSASPSLESMHLLHACEGGKVSAGNDAYLYSRKEEEEIFPQVKLIDTTSTFYRINSIKRAVSRLMEDSIAASLQTGGRVLLYISRHGFSTFGFCPSCGYEMKCGRCDTHLAYHYKDNLLKCPRCVFKIAPPGLCPSCGRDYIRYTGSGTEKIESEIARIFPQARVCRWDDADSRKFSAGSEIVIATSAIIRAEDIKFDLVGVLSVDGALNRLDFRSAEKVFALLCGLCPVTAGKMIIQTAFPGHHCFSWLALKDPMVFYKEELKQRKQLNFSPFSHFVAVKLRGPDEEKVKKSQEALYSLLTGGGAENKVYELFSSGPGRPPKLRGNFYRQIILRGKSPEKMTSALKKALRDFRHSGIIETVDVDPI